ncbi:MAG: hypothetical protein NW217_05095 [Hyphomicrobiaceae bacterium]|nr:hypothetical protein [Hyphomicrobiaceae bacterium]
MGRDEQTASLVARLDERSLHLTHGHRTLEQRVSTLEDEHRRLASTLSTTSGLHDRIQRAEAAVSLLKVAGGLLMFALARSGAVSGEAGKVLERAGGALLGGF